MYNAFKASDKVKPGDRPPQYSTRNEAHGVLEYLDNGQIRAFRKRYGPDAREDLFDANTPFGRRNSNRVRTGSRQDAMEAPFASRRLTTQIEGLQNVATAQISGIVLFGGLFLMCSVLLSILCVRNSQKQSCLKMAAVIQTV